MTDNCACCDNQRTVPDIHGQLRPCSRCRAHAFDQWAEANRLRAINERNQAKKSPAAETTTGQTVK